MKIALVSGSHASAPPTDVVARLKQLRRQRRYEEITDVTAGLFDSPDLAVAKAAHKARAWVAYEQADLGEARSHWEVAAMLDGEDPWMLARLGEAAFRDTRDPAVQERIPAS